MTAMKHRGINIRDYAEPVSEDQLKPGVVYFSVQFLDPEMLIPIVEPFVFLGQDISGSQNGFFYFQRAESYRRGLRYKPSDKRNLSEFQVAKSNGMKHIFTFERALDVL